MTPPRGAVGVYEDLIGWSTTRPRWQQDALRRLIDTGDATVGDISELAELAIRESNGEPVAADPANGGRLPAVRLEQSSVALRALGELTNVNAIADGSRLEFATTGMTVIYGANGSGKSGYVRILRKLVRARAPDAEVQPNVFVRNQTPPSGTVEYSVGQEDRAFTWRQGVVAPDELSAVTVYDRDCATVYVSRENQVAYRPFGLDLLDRLAAAVDNVQSELQQRLYNLRRTLADPPEDVIEQLRSRNSWPLTHEMNINDLATGEPWTDDDVRELELIDRALAAGDPPARAAATLALSRIYRRAAARCNAAAGTLERREPAAIRTLIDQHHFAEGARSIVSESVSGQAPVDGVGTTAWRALWEAARQFSSSSAYPNHAFPAVHSTARCVLCQQTLTEEANARLQAFEAYVATDVTRRATDAEGAVRQARTELQELADSEETDRALLEELQSTDTTRAEVWRTFMTSTRAIARELVGAMDSEDWNLLAERGAAPGEELEREAVRMSEEADVALQAGDPATAAQLGARRKSLRTQEWLGANGAALQAEIDRLMQVQRLSNAIGSCSTTAITTESTALTERYVTRRLADDLASELRRLGASRVNVQISHRGQHGATYNRIELSGVVLGGVRVDEVLSEGEFAAIAMAAYFAEIAQGDHASAIVLDDPVSSLDHVRRGKVAERLVEEARTRQVIVFTHDLVFLYELEAAAARHDVTVAVRRLRRDLQLSGIPEDGPPWHAQKVRTRLGALEVQLASVLRVFEAGDADRYAGVVRQWYGLLRDTWERAVEEVLLGDVVIRFRPDVKTQSATSNKIWLIDEEDVRALHRAMTKVSAQLHDQPQAFDQPPPEPDELAADLAELRGWVEGITTRRR